MKKSVFKAAAIGRVATLCLLLAGSGSLPLAAANQPVVTTQQQADSQLLTLLKGMPELSKIQALKSDEFKEKYQFCITQPIDHEHLEAGTFTQRVFVSHVGFDKPTLIVTEGYGADYALRPNYREELSRIFDMNMVVVEYRYFLESTPQPKDWKYLTVENSLGDLHNVRTVLGKIYKGKWMSTGTSKGGQTTMFYRVFYPNDVDISVPYVAPLNRSVEDGRHEKFLSEQVGTAEERAKVLEFQLGLFQKKQELMPAFKAHCEKNRIKLNRPVEEVFDFCVLEFPFALWQYGTPVSSIPSLDEAPEVLLTYLYKMGDPAYFTPESYFTSFNVQAARQLGYYGYDTKPFKKYLSIKTAKNYLHQLMLPEELKDLKFDTSLYKRTRNFLLKNDYKMLYIYGSIDSWTASGVTDAAYYKNKKQMKCFIEPGGSHRTRILAMPESMKNEIINTLRSWLDE